MRTLPLGAVAALLIPVMSAGCHNGDGAVWPTSPPPPPPPVSPPPPPPGVPAQRIVFDMQPAAGGRRDVYVIQPDGSGLLRLTDDSADHHAPTAHDSTIYFGSTRSSGTVVAYVRLPSAAAPGGRTVESGDAPAPSPDGTMLAYLSAGGPLPRVWVSAIDGTQARRLAAAVGGWDGAVEAHPAWSPTGDRIAYVSTRGGNAAIFVASLTGDTGSASLVTGAATGASLEPTWSPDGTRIAFSSNRDGPTDLYAVTVATGALVKLTAVGHVGQPAWLHDGRIVFTHWTGGVGTLAWLDPAAPTTIHTIATVGDAQHPAAYP